MDETSVWRVDTFRHRATYARDEGLRTFRRRTDAIEVVRAAQADDGVGAVVLSGFGGSERELWFRRRGVWRYLKPRDGFWSPALMWCELCGVHSSPDLPCWCPARTRRVRK